MSAEKDEQGREWLSPECPVGSPDNCPLEPRKDDPWRHQVTERIDAIDGQIAVIRKNTEQIVAFFEAGKGFFQVVRLVGIVAKWVTTVAAAIVVFWFVFKMGVSDILAGFEDSGGK